MGCALPLGDLSPLLCSSLAPEHHVNDQGRGCTKILLWELLRQNYKSQNGLLDVSGRPDDTCVLRP